MDVKVLRSLLDEDAFECCVLDSRILRLIGYPTKPHELAVIRGFCSNEEFTHERRKELLKSRHAPPQPARQAEPKERPSPKPRARREEAETVYIEEELESSVTTTVSNEAALDMFGRRVGEYELKKFLGRGPLGWVFEAEKEDGESYRVKIFPQLVFKSASGLERFLRRGQMMRNRLSHPNIASGIAAGKMGERYCYLVEQWIDGVALRRLLKRGGKLSERVALATLRLLARGLQYAHHRGIMHGNLKPTNVLISKAGTVYSVDWSSPRTAVFAANNTINVTGNANEMEIGYPYIAPELLSGDVELAPTSDVYSMGILLFEMATGNVPYIGEPAQIVDQIRKKGILILEDDGVQVSPQTQDILNRMTAPSVSERYEKVGPCIEDLEKALQSYTTA